jgi:hypothetical protein
MAKSDLALKSHRITIRMTGPMYANLQRVAGTKPRMANIIREAIRLYLDDQGELTGSRRYFTGRFRDEVRILRDELSWQLTLIIILLVELLSFLIRHSVSMDEESAKSFTPTEILKFAEERTTESGWKVRMRVSAAIDEAMLEEHRQKGESD